MLFVVDGREGPSTLDQTILAWLRKTGKPFFLVVNKTDGLDEQALLNEFSRFGVTSSSRWRLRTSAACPS